MNFQGDQQQGTPDCILNDLVQPGAGGCSAVKSPRLNFSRFGGRWFSFASPHGGSVPIAPHRAGLLFFALGLVLCGCTAGGTKAAASEAEYAAGDAFSSTEWTGLGLNPEGTAGGSRADSSDFKDTGSFYNEISQRTENPALNGESPPPEKSRKLIKSARIRARVDNLEEAAAHVDVVLERYQAYAGNSSVYDSSREYTLKIPSVHYEAALQEFGSMGKIVYQSETVEDATLKYYDLDGRLNTRLELLKTFQAYLGKAKTIEEIMTVEKRIAELQQEIDWYGSQLTNLSHLIDYATINLELRGPVSESPYYKPSIKERIAGLFHSFSGIASTALVVLLGIIIYGISALLIVILLFWILFGRIGLIRKIWRLVAAKKIRE